MRKDRTMQTAPQIGLDADIDGHSEENATQLWRCGHTER